jgi:Arc/MetJ-type ribon-helix-helix transcriptional regulator
MSKSRVTVTVDDEALGAARDAVSGGEAESLSSWVNSALLEKAARERRSAALRAAIAEYEAEHGEITDEEIAAQLRADRAGAIVVRGRRTKTGA